MAWRVKRFQCLLWCVAACSLCGFYLALLPMTITEQCNCGFAKNTPNMDEQNQKWSKEEQGNLSSASAHKLAVLVPFRDRFEELLEFAPYMHKFLQKQSIEHHIYILNQVDQYRFNRASLINVGFLYSRNECDYIAMHDVDLLPLNPNLSYSYPELGVFHVAAPYLHPRYNYPNFVGGILLLKREDYESVDGMSNQYWGWGLEDDEFYVRLKEKNLVVNRPQNLTTGRQNTFKHIHNRSVRRRDMNKCFNQREATRRRDRRTGLHNVQYRLSGVKQMKIEGASVTVLNVELTCDKTVSPWCECPSEPTGKDKKKGDRAS